MSLYNVIVPADKSHNYYQMSPEQYNKLLADNIFKDYKKAGKETETNINVEAANIAIKLDLDDRIDVFSHKDPKVIN